MGPVSKLSVCGQKGNYALWTVVNVIFPNGLSVFGGGKRAADSEDWTN